MFPDLEKVIILGVFIFICSFHSAQYSQGMSMLFCNPLADVESSTRSSVNSIEHHCIHYTIIYMYGVVGLFI